MTTALAARPQQIADIKYLIGRLEARGKDLTGTRDALNRCWSEGMFTVDYASEFITTLLNLGEELDMAAQPAIPTQSASSAPVVPDGPYAVRTNDEHYAFYRVWNGDRAVLVYLQVSDEERRLDRTHAANVLAKIAVDPFEAACAYGREIGTCARCGITLTNPDSLIRGMGPICASKF